MRLFRIWLIISAMALALPALAQTTNKFDGTYTGLPGTTTGGAQCPPMETPSALTITNGSIVSASGRFTGTVDAGGRVVLHTKENNRLDGQVDGSGHLTATAVSTKNCAYTFNWQKR
jgi:hypothetical protein